MPDLCFIKCAAVFSLVILKPLARERQRDPELDNSRDLRYCAITLIAAYARSTVVIGIFNP